MEFAGPGRMRSHSIKIYQHYLDKQEAGDHRPLACLTAKNLTGFDMETRHPARYFRFWLIQNRA